MKKVALGLLFCLTAACDGAGPAFEIHVSAPASVPAQVISHIDGLEYRCDDVRLEATATGGKTGSSAQWQGGRFRMYDLGGREQYVETFSAADLAEWWGASRIATGATQVSYWWFYAPEPFRVTIDFEYRLEGSSANRMASVSARCE